jgi:hypothetical protein
VRFRGYRIARRAGVAGYRATYGLPATVNRVHQKRSQLSEDVRQQLRVTGNELREDGRQWEPVGQVINASAAAGRNAARDAAVAGALFTARTHPRSEEGTAPAPASRPAQGTGHARQQVMDSLLNAQRSTWDDGSPAWAGEDSTADQQRVQDALHNAWGATKKTERLWWQDEPASGGDPS